MAVGVGFASAGVACGGANDSGLFGSSSGSNNNGGSEVDSGGTIDVDASSSAGMDASPGEGKDAGLPPNDASTSVDAAAPQDSAAPPPQKDQGVQCGTVYCPVPAQACCRRQVGGNYSYTCMPAGQCQGLAGNALEIPCDDSTDCTAAGQSGTVCCATIGGQGGGNAASEISCRAPSDCTQQSSATPVCDPSGPNDCPTGTTCKASTVSLPSYNLCF